MMTGPAKRAEARVLRRKQPHKEGNTRRSRKLVQGRTSVAKCEPLHTRRCRSGAAIRGPFSRNEPREISRTVHVDVSIQRFHRSSFNGITLAATEGYALFLKTPWTEHDCSRVVLQTQQSCSRNTLKTRQSKGCLRKTKRVGPTALSGAAATKKHDRVQRRDDLALSFAAPSRSRADSRPLRGEAQYAVEPDCQVRCSAAASKWARPSAAGRHSNTTLIPKSGSSTKRRSLAPARFAKETHLRN